MATIKREEKSFDLTNEEIRSIMQEKHMSEVRCMYEDAVAECESEGWISFASYASCGFAEYASEDDARADFIEKLTEDYIEKEGLYERDPGHFREYSDYSEDVLELAEDLDFRIDED